MESFASGVGVSIVALPGIESGVLKGTSEAKGDRPGERTIFGNLGKIIGGLFDGLATREEDDAGEVTGNVGFKDFGGFSANFGGGGLAFLLFASENHIDFKDTSAEIYSGGFELFKEAIEDFAGDFSRLFDSVISIVNKLWFDNGDDAGLLTF